jgi:hypothetical protein
MAEIHLKLRGDRSIGRAQIVGWSLSVGMVLAAALGAAAFRQWDLARADDALRRADINFELVRRTAEKEIQSAQSALSKENASTGAKPAGPEGGVRVRNEQTGHAVAELRERINKLEASNRELSALLGDDPQKKMGVVLLSKDMDSLKRETDHVLSLYREEQKMDSANLRAEAKTNFDILLWAIVFAGISNVVGPLIGYLQKKPSPLSEASDK